MHTCIFSIINLIFHFFDEHSISRKHFRHNILWIVSWMKEIASDRLIIYRWCNQRERVTDKEQHHQHWSVITELNICTYTFTIGEVIPVSKKQTKPILQLCQQFILSRTLSGFFLSLKLYGYYFNFRLSKERTKNNLSVEPI